MIHFSAPVISVCFLALDIFQRFVKYLPTGSSKIKKIIDSLVYYPGIMKLILMCLVFFIPICAGQAVIEERFIDYSYHYRYQKNTRDKDSCKIVNS